MAKFIIVCTAAQQSAANAAALTWDPEWGNDTWSVGLNASGRGVDPPTHYWASWTATGDDLALVQAAVSEVGMQYFDDKTPDDVLTLLELKRIDPYA